MNDLTVEKVNAFQNLIKSCGDIVRVELADVSSIPFLVNLYHPTVQGKNLGKLFYRCKEHAEQKAARESRWNKKLTRMVSFAVLIFDNLAFISFHFIKVSIRMVFIIHDSTFK